VIYLGLHIWVIGAVNQGKDVFDSAWNFWEPRFFHIFGIGLLAAVIYHAFDGIRLLIVARILNVNGIPQKPVLCGVRRVCHSDYRRRPAILLFALEG